MFNFIVQLTKYLNDEQYNLLRSGKIKKDDILFCIRGSLAKNGISKFTKGAIASSLVILRSYNKRLISPLFYWHIVTLPKYQVN